MAKIILVRHGHVEGIHPKRFRGRMDVPLTPEGARQAFAVAECVAARWRPAVVYTSPLRRCLETAGPIAAATAVEAVALSELIDIDYGEWQWRTCEEVRNGWPALLDCWLTAPHLVRFPRGESLQDLLLRTANALRVVLERHATDTVVLVGHDSGIRAALLQLLDQPISAYRRLASQPGSISEAEIQRNQVSVLSINETQHLQPLQMGQRR